MGYDSGRYWPRTLSAGALSLAYDNHDGVGNVGTIGDSRSGYAQALGYDNLDRLTSASGSYGSLTYAYNAHGNRQTAGGVTYSTSPTTLRLLSQNSTSFGYDNSGNTTTAGSNTFTYTTDQQLDTATVGGVTSTYGYDGDGWRATRSRAGQVSDYLRGPDGQLLSEVQSPGTSTVVVRDYIYAGSQLLAVTGGVTPTFTFTDSTLTAGVTAVKAVHITELRTAVDSYRAAAGLGAATWTDPALSGIAIKAIHIQELRARLDEARAALGYAPASYTDSTLTAGTTSIRVVHITELRTLLQQPGTSGSLRYYHTDAIGSVRMTTDYAGSVVERLDYQPFGEPLAASSERRRFTGAERDADTGFDYLGARYLSSTIGRFTRSDDLGFGNPLDPQSMNLYAYVYNNPLRYVDPTGHAVNCVPGNNDLCVDEAGFTESAFGDWLGFLDNGAEGLLQSERTSQQLPREPAVSTTLDRNRMLQSVGNCFAEHYGITAAAASAGALGLPIPKAWLGASRGLAGASETTSVAGAVGYTLFGANEPRIAARILGTTRVFGIIGRAAPIVSAGLFAWDAVSIGYCAYQGRN